MTPSVLGTQGFYWVLTTYVFMMIKEISIPHFRSYKILINVTLKEKSPM